ncbi:3-hydroxyisobutyryl-CoA hydrolase [Methylocella tundrae]|uniref:3-hydroxyisobutyryl-CoA hydrolase n=1 Tax=Methylocella tundrae TaxID=227605 RepID=A0A8B6M1H5_METTU|nr:enoyl-CoA hydratase/isomerase family protein [Methylocella tundrae]VTZ27669.1 3-hydroxyisobutyryl-CoA hydrolase [Methylocella tundrae]VTZ48881.1 3-hydroxyisobutyryl-CoA hydrolase [Methylocella tundrae]
MSEAKVIIETLGRCGVITLNRPAALNSLDLDMVRAIHEALDRWENDAAAASVLIRGAGGRAFCAGADIRALYQLGKAGRAAEQLAFFREEYSLNRRINNYPKPYVALMDGVVMGGGAGLSVHGSHRVAGDALDFAMPEVGIGFFPDVGATYFLPRLPGRTGAYLALTGARIGCAEAIALGLASAYVPSARHDALTRRLIEGEDAAAAIAAESRPAPPSTLSGQRPFIDACFSAATVAEVVAKAGADGSAFADKTLAALLLKSPTSLAIALRQMQIGADLGLEEALRIEFRIVARILQSNDYYEGVRATIIEKDHRPRWSPAAIDAVSKADINAYFAALPDDLAFCTPVAR